MCQGGRIFQQMVKKEYCVGEGLRIMKGLSTIHYGMNQTTNPNPRIYSKDSEIVTLAVAYLSQSCWFYSQGFRLHQLLVVSPTISFES